MNNFRVEWQNCYKPVAKKRIAVVEEKLGINFPISYRQTVAEYNGRLPKKDAFDFFLEMRQSVWGSGIGEYLDLTDSGSNNLLSLNLDPPEFFPEGLIAFAEDGGGDFMCFDYRKGKDNPDPPIVYWCHEGSEDDSVSFLADNFEAFLDMLYEFDEAELDALMIEDKNTNDAKDE